MKAVILVTILIVSTQSLSLSKLNSIKSIPKAIIEENGSHDSSRRSIIAGSALILNGILSGRASASESDRVVLSTASYPTKYAGTSTAAVTDRPSILDSISNEELRRIQIFERTAPSVVFIDTFTEQRDAFTTNVMEVPLGSGSGFVWDDKGHIVTNYHVIRNSQSAQVTVLTRAFDDSDNGRTSSYKSIRNIAPTNMRPSQTPVLANYKRSVYKARVIGVDPGKDVAVLKIDAPVYDLYPIEVGSSKSIRVGQTALAIGNPFGLDHTLTSGIISGLGREVKSPTGQPITDVIQTDAAINPGNSGGPLIDSSGRLIGMNTAIYSTSGGSAGIGFAIPIDTVKFIVDTLIRDGRVVRPALGISYLASSQAKALGITRGILVLDVPVNSPAYKAGLRGTRRSDSGLIELGDIIVKVADTAIESESDLFRALENYKPGDFVKVTVSRLDANGTALKAREVVLTIQLKVSESQLAIPTQNYHSSFR
jgi:S1-C subfamily serine protease